MYENLWRDFLNYTHLQRNGILKIQLRDYKFSAEISRRLDKIVKGVVSLVMLFTLVISSAHEAMKT